MRRFKKLINIISAHSLQLPYMILHPNSIKDKINVLEVFKDLTYPTNDYLYLSYEYSA